ncbi:MAG: putative zinc-binding protein [Dehalococcoidia bacterium]|nr:putative zinc-binding protein [Dehalococcoidia bacterium]
MGRKDKKVVVMACSGIGKPLGALARETTYELIERVRPGTAITTCLPLVVIGDPEARNLVLGNPVISIDGCAKECAKKSLESQGAKVARSYQTLDFLKKHKGLKPEGISELNEAGQKLAALSADDLGEVVDELVKEDR